MYTTLFLYINSSKAKMFWRQVLELQYSVMSLKLDIRLCLEPIRVTAREALVHGVIMHYNVCS